MAKTPSRMELDLLSPLGWVKEERRRQVKARGEQNHNPLRWFLTLAEEFGEAAKVINDRMEGKIQHDVYTDELEYELIQTAAVAVAFVEAIRRGKHSATAPACICPDCRAEHIAVYQHNEKEWLGAWGCSGCGGELRTVPTGIFAKPVQLLSSCCHKPVSKRPVVEAEAVKPAKEA